MTDHGKIDSRFLIDYKGKQFVLYSGLLSLAHEEGLSSLVVDLIQAPSDTNDHTAICRATAITSKGTFTEIGDANTINVGTMVSKHIIRMAATRSKARALRDAVNIGITSFEELGGDDGDDTPHQSARPAQSVRPPPQAVVDAAIKDESVAQAWQGTSFEGQRRSSPQSHNPPVDDVPLPDYQGQAPARPQAPPQAAQHPSGSGEAASDKQQKAIFAIARGMGMSKEDIDIYVYDRVGVYPPGLTKNQASTIIESLKK